MKKSKLAVIVTAFLLVTILTTSILSVFASPGGTIENGSNHYLSTSSATQDYYKNNTNEYIYEGKTTSITNPNLFNYEDLNKDVFSNWCANYIPSETYVISNGFRIKGKDDTKKGGADWQNGWLSFLNIDKALQIYLKAGQTVTVSADVKTIELLYPGSYMNVYLYSNKNSSDILAHRVLPFTLNETKKISHTFTIPKDNTYYPVFTINSNTVEITNIKIELGSFFTSYCGHYQSPRNYNYSTDLYKVNKMTLEKTLEYTYPETIFSGVIDFAVDDPKYPNGTFISLYSLGNVKDRIFRDSKGDYILEKNVRLSYGYYTGSDFLQALSFQPAEYIQLKPLDIAFKGILINPSGLFFNPHFEGKIKITTSLNNIILLNSIDGTITITTSLGTIVNIFSNSLSSTDYLNIPLSDYFSKDTILNIEYTDPSLKYYLFHCAIYDRLESFSNGYNSGSSDGYRDGFTAGKASVENALDTGKNFFFDILSTPINFMKNVFNFDILGVNVSSIILFLVSALLIAFLIRRLK